MRAIRPTADLAVAKPLAAARRYRPDVDGLRAVAVLLVVAFHAFPHYVRAGFVGVDVFFVISGFLITGIIFDELEGQDFSLWNFYGRRIRRIFPALILVLAAVFVAGWWLLFPAELMRLGQQISASAAFVANIYLWTQSGYFSPDANTYPLLHLWSLSVEEQFYLVWPLVIVGLWRRPRLMLPAIAAIGLASFMLNVALANHRAVAFYFPTTRVWELMIGAALSWRAHLLSDRPTPKRLAEVATAVGLIMIVGAALLLKGSAPYPGWRALIPTFGAALILWGGGAAGIGSAALGSRIPVFIGLISYPLYLWHWPMLWLGRIINPAGNDWRTIAAICGGAVILAWLTHEFVERSARSGYQRNPLLTTAGLAGALLIVGLSGAFVAVDGMPGRLPKEIHTLATYKFDEVGQYREGKCLLLPNQGPLYFPAECFSDGSHAGGRIVLWGDSSATALYLGLHSLNDGRFDIAELTASACPPFIDDYRPLAERPNCSAINAFVLNHIRAQPPDIVILSAAPNYDADIPAHMRNTIVALREIGVPTVMVVGPPPIWPYLLPETILRNYSPLTGIPNILQLPSAERSHMAQLDSALRGVAADAGAFYVSAFGRLCEDGLCTVMINGEPTVWDSFHLTLGGSTLVAGAIYEAIDPRRSVLPDRAR
jgi:peptidoglycan/LPS O-acetylase OafA/YrhL